MWCCRGREAQQPEGLWPAWKPTQHSGDPGRARKGERVHFAWGSGPGGMRAQLRPRSRARPAQPVQYPYACLKVMRARAQVGDMHVHTRTHEHKHPQRANAAPAAPLPPPPPPPLQHLLQEGLDVGLDRPLQRDQLMRVVRQRGVQVGHQGAAHLPAVGRSLVGPARLYQGRDGPRVGRGKGWRLKGEVRQGRPAWACRLGQEAQACRRAAPACVVAAALRCRAAPTLTMNSFSPGARVASPSCSTRRCTTRPRQAAGQGMSLRAAEQQAADEARYARHGARMIAWHYARPCRTTPAPGSPAGTAS